MNKVLNVLKALLQPLVDKAKAEPAVAVGALASLLVALAAQFNIVIDQASLVVVLTPLVSGALTRLFVTPTNKNAA